MSHPPSQRPSLSQSSTLAAQKADIMKQVLENLALVEAESASFFSRMYVPLVISFLPHLLLIVGSFNIALLRSNNTFETPYAPRDALRTSFCAPTRFLQMHFQRSL